MTTYTVKAGDTLGNIAAMLGTTVDEIVRENGIWNPDLINIGQILKVPSKSSCNTEARSNSYKSMINYKVMPGDTLNKIASKFGTNVSNLVSINGISNPDLIQIGQVLRIQSNDSSARENKNNNCRNVQSQELGILSAQYESNGDPGIIANNSGDAGGKSYGKWQFNTRDRVIISFMNWLANNNQSIYSKLHNAFVADGNTNGNNFDAAWRELGRVEHDTFSRLQHDYTKSQYYDQASNILAGRYGFDINKRSFALMNVLWSSAVQHGVNGAIKIFEKAGLHKNDRDLINAIYDERSNVDALFWDCSPDVRRAVYNRYINERADSLRMLN